jgi:hypothetical protein
MHHSESEEWVMYSEGYVRTILSLAPFVVCLALALDPKWRRHGWWLGGATLFGLSATYSPVAVWGCLPWLGLTVGLAFSELKSFVAKPHFRLAELAVLASALYLPVGGVWALFDQLGYQPLGFPPIIVLLTAVHFHYAGFALPRLTGLWVAKQKASLLSTLATWGVIAGVPLVAIGITTSQLQMSPWIEVVSVTTLACSALVVSVGQIVWSIRADMPALARLFFVLGGFCLAAGMVLAMIYGWRSVYPVAWATIPAMYAIHGTLNSMGFCLPGFLGWHLAKGSIRSSN